MITIPTSLRFLVLCWLCASSALRAGLSVDLPADWSEYALPAEAQLKTREFEGMGKRNCLIDINLAGLSGNALKTFADVPAALSALTAKMSNQVVEGYKEVAVKSGKLQFLYSSFEDPQFRGKTLGKGKFHFVTRCVGLWDEKVVIVASLFTDSLKGPDFEEGLQILRSLKVDDNQEIKGSPHSVICNALKTRITFPPEVPLARDGHTDPKNHFQIQYPNTSVVASGWIDKAKNYKEFTSFWAGEKKKLGSILTLTDEKFEDVAGWSTVIYTATMGPITQVNLRACKVVKGIWYDIHLSSVGGPERRDLLRKIIAATETNAL